MIRDHVHEVKRRLFLLKLIDEQYLDSCLSEDTDLRSSSIGSIRVLLETFLQSLELSLDEIEQEARTVEDFVVRYDRN